MASNQLVPVVIVVPFLAWPHRSMPQDFPSSFFHFTTFEGDARRLLARGPIAAVIVKRHTPSIADIDLQAKVVVLFVPVSS
jgi:hypothetical protein